MKIQALRAFCLLALAVGVMTTSSRQVPGQERYPLFEEMSSLDEAPPFYQKSPLEPDPRKERGSWSDPEVETYSPRVASLLSSNFNTTASALFQAPAANQAASTTETGRSKRKTKSPKNHGDSLITNRFSFQNWTYSTHGFADFVVPGRLYIGNNNGAETDNRLIFQTNVFKNSLDSSVTDGVGATQNKNGNTSQFLVGFEKTLDAAQQWSLEMRMPVYGSSDAVYDDGFSTQNASVGNLAMILKRQIYEDDSRVISTGLGLSVPTGNDASFIAGEELFTVKNRATYLAPFIAGLWTPNDKWFYRGFLTFDVAASGNTIEYRNVLPCGCPGGELGKFDNQTLLNLDLSAGYWWFRDREKNLVRAMSSMIELHYTTSLDDSDMVVANTPYNYVEFSSTGGNNFDYVNVTAGFDFNIIDRLNLRFATVLPINDEFNRFFDVEWQTSINFLR